jgi:hypothetical protein
LHVLVPPKFAKISIEKLESQEQQAPRDFLVENDRVQLECCTNSDVNPDPIFEWHRQDQRAVAASTSAALAKLKYRVLRSNRTVKLNEQLNRLCNYLPLNLTRYDNDAAYKCVVTNDALFNKPPAEDTILLNVECKK